MLFLHLCRSLQQDPSEWSSGWVTDSVTQRDVWRVSATRALQHSSLQYFKCIINALISIPEEAAYRSFYSPEDYPIIKELRAPVYIEVHILDRSDPSLILNLEHCWATSTPNAHSLPQWDLLVDGYIKYALRISLKSL